MKKLIFSFSALLLLAVAAAFVPGVARAETVTAGAAPVACGRVFARGTPTIFIMSAPSGAGKTTLISKLMANFPGTFTVSISTTTRAPRPGEVDGKDYHFTDVAEFKKQIAAGHFAEWAEVHGNFYGTSKTLIEQSLRQGQSVFLNINVDGAENIRKAFPGQVKTIFIAPPSLQILEQRLRGRGTETEANIQKRLGAVKAEMEQAKYFEKVIVNDDLERAYGELRDHVLPVAPGAPAPAAGAP